MYDVTFEPTFHDFPINTNKERGLGCILKILNKYENCLSYMVFNHSKVMQVRFDLRFPSDGSVQISMDQVYRFNQYLKRELKRIEVQGGHLVDPCYVAVIEQGHSCFPHLHFVVLVNANAIEQPITIWNLAEKCWGLVLKTQQKGLVHYCVEHENGIILKRGADDFDVNLRKMFYQASYLAKIRDKDNRSIGAHPYLSNHSWGYCFSDL